MFYIRLSKVIFLSFALMVLSAPSIFSRECKYVQVKCKSGDGLTILLAKYLLPVNDLNISKFKELNKKKILKNDELIKNAVYNLPIAIYNYSGKNLRLTVGIDNKQTAEKIKQYNTDIVQKKLKRASYIDDNKLWVPLYLISNNESFREKISPIKETVEKDETETLPLKKKGNEPGYVIEPLLGKKYEKVKIVDKKLSGHYFYLESGHGGPDPGAIGKMNGHELCEDEYAYDFILRLARNIMEHSGTVYIIVRDDNDGIRDDAYLKASSNEYLINGDSISPVQTIRLKQRADIINSYYKANSKKAKSQQAIIIHLDSRVTKKRIDIFFYHQENNARSELLANNLYETVKQNYAKYQPGRCADRRGRKSSRTSA